MLVPPRIWVPALAVPTAIAALWGWTSARPFPDEPILLFQQLLALSIAGGPLAWTLHRARAERWWYLFAGLFGWTLLVPLEPWFPHDAGDQGFTCGRLGFIPAGFGNVYLDAIESWAWAAPKWALLATCTVVAWRERSLEMAMWTLLGAAAMTALMISGRPHDCD